MSLMQRLTDQLVVDEGEALHMYPDSRNILTIGVGHNLRDKPITQRASRTILEDDIIQVFNLMDKYLPWWRNKSEDIQYVLSNMAFNMGVGPSPEEPTGSFLTFKNTLQSFQEDRYKDAAEGMKNSLWAKQVGERADRLIEIVERS